MHKINRIFLSWFCIILVIYYIPILQYSEIPKRVKQNYINDKIQAAKLYSPISIKGDAELDAFPDKTGNGSLNNPYIIRDLEIDAGGVGSAIEIHNTKKYLVLLNLTVYNPGSVLNYYQDAGIR